LWLASNLLVEKGSVLDGNKGQQSKPRKKLSKKIHQDPKDFFDLIRSCSKESGILAKWPFSRWPV
jgi:hypothetical protein